MTNRRFKPMMFRTPEMRAYIDGRKTMTRRVLYPQPRFSVVRKADGTYFDGDCMDKMINRPLTSPYLPGDLLWIKETWTSVAANNICHQADDYVVYRATDPDWSEYEGWRWRSSMFMPKSVCRHIAEVLEVRKPEQVQSITEAECIAEGVTSVHETPMTPEDRLAYRPAFIALWDSIHWKSEHRWSANPWVWPITFRPLEGDELTEALAELKG